jgi:hypothetical protein
MPYKETYRKERRRERYHANATAEVLAKRAKRYRDRYSESRLAFIELCGGCCERCGFTDVRALQIDHVNGGGVAERKKRGPAMILTDLWKPGARKKYQVLCANCNQIKRVEEKEYSEGGPRRFVDPMITVA